MTSIYDAWDNGDRHEIRQQFARREEIIKLAREAGFCVEQINTFDEVFAPDDSYYTQHPNVGYEVLTGILERFAALVAAAEREACAKVCEENADDDSEGDWDNACNNCAYHIRARGNT